MRKEKLMPLSEGSFTYRGYTCTFSRGKMACPKLKLKGYSTPTMLERAIDRKLVVGGSRKPYPKGRNPRLTPFAGAYSGKYPVYRVEGREFSDIATARAFAQQRVLNTGETATIMKKEDHMSPTFMLEKWTPENTPVAYDLTKKNPYVVKTRRKGSRSKWTTAPVFYDVRSARDAKRYKRKLKKSFRGYSVKVGKYRRNPGIKVGDKVAYSAAWLRSTGQMAGEAGHARGVVKKLANLGRGASPLVLAHVKWDRDMPEKVNVNNLAVVGKYGFSAMNPGSVNDIRPGDTVEFLNYAGMGRGGPEYKPKRGRAVMKGDYGWVLNAGGAHGTPAIVDGKNFLRIVKRGR